MDTQHTALVPAHVPSHVTTPVLPADLTQRVHDLRAASRAENTRRAYLSDWAGWLDWCQLRGVCPMPAHADTVAAYLADRADSLKVSTLSRHLATISKAHQIAGVPNPCRETTVKDTLAGLRRTYGMATDEAQSLMADQLAATVRALDTSPAATRDRAVLLLGWSAGLRRSEIVGLTWADITPDPDGLVITLRKSKTDQTGAGRQVGIPRQDSPDLCPVVALELWRQVSDPDPSAPLFVTITKHAKMGTKHMTGHAVALIIKKRTQQAGLVGQFRGHSLRKGLVQTASLAGVSDSAIMATTGHQSVTMLRRYQGTAGLVSRAASKGLLV
jgi:integrase